MTSLCQNSFYSLFCWFENLSKNIFNELIFEKLDLVGFLSAFYERFNNQNKQGPAETFGRSISPTPLVWMSEMWFYSLNRLIQPLLWRGSFKVTSCPCLQWRTRSMWSRDSTVEYMSVIHRKITIQKSEKYF